MGWHGRIQSRNLLILSALLAASLAGCMTLPAAIHNNPAPARSAALTDYYQVGRSYRNVEEFPVNQFDNYKVRRFRLASDSGPVWLDFFDGPSTTDSLVLVFPVLGGNSLIESYFADYITKAGFDTAIVHRSDEFRDPENFHQLEQVFRENVIRDRIALDFFEKELGKKRFGSFGISRGAINVAMTAGADPRLAHNVLVLGGTDIISLFRSSDQNGIRKYVRTVSTNLGISEAELFSKLEGRVTTDPKYLSQYLDPTNTLLVLAAFDSTVPFASGMKLRRQIGNPETILLLADHYVALLYTQLIKLVPPIPGATLFPLDYVESEAIAFYSKKFDEGKRPWLLWPLRVLKAPLDGIGWCIERLLHSKPPQQVAPEFPAEAVVAAKQ